MAIRQYIGARYVPRFTGLYDVTQSYEALDVVDNGTGTSYIAKIPTPAGTPLTNTDYWFLYGSTNGAIVNLQQQIDDMKDGNVPGSLQAQINANTTDVQDVADEILFSNRKFLFIGDSYDTIGSPTWSDRVASMLGVSYVKRAAAGYGFYRDGVNTWENYLIANPVPDPEEITDIVIAGGANDVNASSANLSGAIVAMNTYLRATFPNVNHIYLAFIGWSFAYGDSVNYYPTEQVYLGAAQRLGWKYINNAKYCLHNPAYLEAVGQRNHPVPGAINMISDAICQGIINGDCSCEYSMRSTLTPDNSTFGGNPFNITFRMANDITSVTFPDISLTALHSQLNGQSVPFADCTAGNNVCTKPHYFPFMGMSGNTFIAGYILANSETKYNLWLRVGSITQNDSVLIFSSENAADTMWL